MSANQACYPIATMSRVLGVSKAGYYAWVRRPPSAHATADAALLKRVRTVYASSRQTYGAPRVHAGLQERGEQHGRKRIARLMRQAGLVEASHRPGGPVTTRRDQEARPAPDLVDRRFSASGPNQLWVADTSGHCNGTTFAGWVATGAEGWNLGVSNTAATQSWDLVKALLALHRAGTFEVAAARLGLDPTTVRRRIQALGRQLGIAPFVRRDGQFVLAAQQEAVLEYALQMEAAYSRLLAHSSMSRLGGRLRITTLDIFAALLAPDLADLHHRHPDIQIELTTEPHFVDLERERIDLAIRLARPLRGGDGLKRLATMHFAIYGARGAPPDRVRPALLALYPHHGRMDHEFLLADERWHEAYQSGTIVARADGYPTLLRLCEERLGLALLPCLLGDASPRLQRIDPGKPTVEVGVWAVIRQDVSRWPKVRAVLDFLVERFAAHGPALAGQGD